MPEAGGPTPGGHDDALAAEPVLLHPLKNTEPQFMRSRKNTDAWSGHVQQGEGAVEGRPDDWGEVVTR